MIIMNKIIKIEVIYKVKKVIINKDQMMKKISLGNNQVKVKVYISLVMSNINWLFYISIVYIINSMKME